MQNISLDVFTAYMGERLRATSFMRGVTRAQYEHKRNDFSNEIYSMWRARQSELLTMARAIGFEYSGLKELCEAGEAWYEEHVDEYEARIIRVDFPYDEYMENLNK